MTTRAARFEDMPESLRLIRRAIEHGCRDHYDRRQRDAVYASYACTLFVDVVSPFETIAAEHEARLVGIAALDPASDRLRALFVDAALQGRGVGRALLGAVEERARRRGCVRLSGAMALNAVSFYTRAGFRPSGGPERLTTSGVFVPVLRMDKDLLSCDGGAPSLRSPP
jgi:GNAT superfamily N-acetyltransferase